MKSGSPARQLQCVVLFFLHELFIAKIKRSRDYNMYRPFYSRGPATNDTGVFIPSHVIREPVVLIRQESGISEERSDSGKRWITDQNSSL